MDDALMVTVPDVLLATYVVATRREVPDAEDAFRSAIDGLAEPVRSAVRQMVDASLVRFVAQRLEDLPPLPVPLLKAFGATDEQASTLAKSRHSIAITAHYRPGWPPLHEWAARGVAAGIAARVDGVLIDVFTPRVLDPVGASASLPSAARQMCISDWVLVPQSAGEHGLWLTTKGLQRFGLPELQAVDVPQALAGAYSAVLSGIASRLLSAWTSTLAAAEEMPAVVEIPAELEVAEADVARAYDRDPMPGGGSAVVRLRLDPPESPEGMPFLSVLAPSDGPNAAPSDGPNVVSSDGPNAVSSDGPNAVPSDGKGAVPGDAFAGSAGGVAAICAALFGSQADEIRRVVHSRAMADAIAAAREALPSARERFLAGDLPAGGQIVVKHRLPVGTRSELVWSTVTSWTTEEHIAGVSLTDAESDENIRVGRAVRIGTDTVMDWAVWINGSGFVEGGWTDRVLFGEPVS